MRRFGWWCVVFTLASCSSSPKPKPVEEPTQADIDAMLDSPVDTSRRRTSSGSSPAGEAVSTMLVLPDTPESPSKEIDGKDDDWKGVKTKQFASKGDVQDGAEFWRGKGDASMKVSVDSDAGFLYFFVEVRDDEVVVGDTDDDPTDGVVIWLRDPGLDAIGDALPSNVGLDEYVDAEMAVVIRPSGFVEPWTDDRPDFNRVMMHEVSERKGGYTLEVAFKLEAFGEISSIPLEQIAFRVELLDGDDDSRPGWQTRMSTLPEDGSDSPRFSLVDTAGLLPHAAVSGAPPRTNAIGRWQFVGDSWSFASFEVVPKVWVSVDDDDAILEAVADDTTIGELCAAARNDVRVAEAYESSKGGFRSALLVCGTSSPGDRCPAGAKTSAYLVDLRREGSGDETRWFVDQVSDVFGEELSQCASRARPGEDFYSRFSLYPLDVLGSTVWVVGWMRTNVDRGYEAEAFGVTMLNTKYAQPRLGTTVTRSRVSESDERSIATSSVYLTYVDDDENVDICQVENLLEQACTGVDRGCRTYERGKSVLTHIQLWNKKKRRFERYELTKHRGCTPSFDFSDAEGYLVLQLRDRVGLLPSPRTNDTVDDDDKLELF